MNKPYSITALDNSKDIGLLDNLFTIVFSSIQDKEHIFLTFSGTGVWPTAAMIGEKQMFICKNTTDNAVRVYTKISGALWYVALTAV
jgi:uncharacterized caspase-like protein